MSLKFVRSIAGQIPLFFFDLDIVGNLLTGELGIRLIDTWSEPSLFVEFDVV